MNKILTAALFATAFSASAFAEDAPPSMADIMHASPAMRAPGQMHGHALDDQKGDCDSAEHGMSHDSGMMDMKGDCDSAGHGMPHDSGMMGMKGDCDSMHGMAGHHKMDRNEDDCDSKHTRDGKPGYGMGDRSGMGMMGGHPGRGMGGSGYGMRGGQGAGMMMEPNMSLLGALDLSKAQMAKITKIADKLKHDNWATQGLLNDETAKLRDLYEADKRDPAAIGRKYQKVFDLKRRMIETYLEAENRIEDILTPGQLGVMKEARHSMRHMYEQMQ